MTVKSSLSPDKAQKAIVATVRHYQKKKLREARKAIAPLFKSDWKDPNSFFQTGIAAFNAGDIETSIRLYEKATSLVQIPGAQHAQIFMALGSAYSTNGNIEQAILTLDKSIQLDSNNAGAFNNRALAQLKAGNKDDALNDLQKAHSLSPNNIDFLLNLCDLLTSTNNNEGALALYKKYSALHPDVAEIHIRIGTLVKNDSPLEAFHHHRKAVYLDPRNDKYLQAYSGIIQIFPKIPNLDSMKNDLIILLSSNSVHWNYLNAVVRQYIKTRPAFQPLIPAISLSVRSNQELKIDFGTVIKALSDNVLLLALKKMRIVDPEIEKLLELFRRLALTAIVSGATLEKSTSDLLKTFLIPLAHHCFFTEFLYTENEFEKNAISSLIEYFEAGVEEKSERVILRYLILSCYRQCHNFSFAKNLTGQKLFTDQADLAELIKTQITEPDQETVSRKSIDQLTQIDDAISLNVREQYEENPYPRWQNLPATGGMTYATSLAAKLPILEGQAPNFPQAPKLLIAGCGTGRQPISSARAYPETNVLAVDLSLASISYAMRKAEELNVKNITFGQADIMELGSLNQKFHIIECSGVLHHMNDPEAGWRVLCDLLEDDGYMNIGLYSELGRKDVIACRQYIQEKRIGDSLEDIRECRRSLMAIDKSHPASKIVNHNDFYTISACRDLIFHVQEHRFTIARITAALDKLGLEFLGFNLDAKIYLPKYQERFPEDINRTNLDNWAVFEEENPNVFATMYKFWVRKKRDLPK